MSALSKLSVQIAFLLLLLNTVAIGQSLVPSTSVDLIYKDQPLKAEDVIWQQYYEGELYVLTDVKTLLKFASDGALLSATQVNYPYGSPFEGHPISATSFQVIDTAICFLNNHGLIVLNRDAGPLYIRPFGYKDYKGADVLMYPFTLPNLLIVPELDIVIHPVNPTFDKEVNEPKYWYDERVFSHKGLYNIYNLTNQLQHSDREREDFYTTSDTTIGTLHPIFIENHLPYMRGRNVCIDVSGKRLWESQSASADIKGISLTGLPDVVFGEKGNHLFKMDTLRSVPLSELTDSNKHIQGMYLDALECLSPTYEQIHYDEASGYMYRIYATPLDDKSRIAEIASHKTPKYFVKYLNSLKRRYLQVYDAKHSLVSDVQIPSVCRILAVNNQRIIALVADDYAASLKLVTYVIN